MTDRELMQQALHAFESGRAADRAEAMTALRAALATPPRSEWVGLTDEDFPAMRDGDHAFYSGMFCAEAKMKEKNT